MGGETYMHDTASLAVRLQHLSKQRADVEQETASLVSQLLHNLSIQNEAFNNISRTHHQELDKERMRATQAETSVKDLTSTVTQLRTRVAIQENALSEMRTFRDQLAAARKEISSLTQEVAQAKSGESEALQRVQQLEAELTEVHEQLAVAQEQLSEAQQDAEHWKEACMSQQSHMPPPYPPHGLPPHPGMPMDGSAGPDAARHGGVSMPPLPPMMHPMMPPWMAGQPWGAPWLSHHPVVHTPLPPPLSQQPPPPTLPELSQPVSEPAPAQRETQKPAYPATQGPAQQAPIAPPSRQPPAQPAQPAPEPQRQQPTAALAPLRAQGSAAPPLVSNTSGGPLAPAGAAANMSRASTGAPSRNSTAGSDVANVGDVEVPSVERNLSGQHLLGLIGGGAKAQEAGAGNKGPARNSKPPNPAPQTTAAEAGATAAAPPKAGKRQNRKRHSGGGGGRGAAGSDASGDVAVNTASHSDQNIARQANVPRPPQNPPAGRGPSPKAPAGGKGPAPKDTGALADVPDASNKRSDTAAKPAKGGVPAKGARKPEPGQLSGKN